MKDLISKLLVDENIQDIPVLYICRIAIELVKLSEETMISPSLEDPVNLIKYRNRLLDTVRKECDCDVRLSSNEPTNQLSQHDEQSYESNGNEHAE